MGIFGDAWSLAKKGAGYTPVGMVANAVMNEDTRSKIPVLNELTGAKSDAEKRLLEKQEQLGREARQKREQMQQGRMNALAQQLMAFNPQNQMMAQMFGPQAAFSPEQFAQMAKNPLPNETPWGTGTDDQRVAQVQRKQAEQARQQQIRQQMAPVPAGPQPFQMRGPQAGRRY